MQAIVRVKHSRVDSVVLEAGHRIPDQNGYVCTIFHLARDYDTSIEVSKAEWFWSVDVMGFSRRIREARPKETKIHNAVARVLHFSEIEV